MNIPIDDPRDLQEPLPTGATESHRNPTGESWLMEVDGNLHVYHHDPDLFIGEQLSKRLISEQGWFEKLVTHRPSIGTFYEDALRAILSEVLPARYKVGTGFIFDPETRRHSKQLDILVYDDYRSAPLYRRGNFVVITPDQAVAQAEVKKQLKLGDVREIIKSSISSHFGNHLHEPPGCHRLCIFAYHTSPKPGKIFDVVRSEIATYLKKFKAMTKGGNEASIAISTLVIPRFYFLDRQECIVVNLHKNRDLSYSLTVTETLSNLANGLSDFLHEMIVEEVEMDRRTFRTLPLANYVQEATIESSLFLARQIPILSLHKYFPNDREEIQAFRFNGKRPFALVIPSALDLNAISRFRDLLSQQHLMWVTTEQGKIIL